MIGKYLIILLSCSQIFPSYCYDDERDIYSTFNETNTWPQESDVVTESINQEKNINYETTSINEKVVSISEKPFEDNSVNDIDFMYENWSLSNIHTYDVVIEDLKIINVSDDSLTISWKVNSQNDFLYNIKVFKDNTTISSETKYLPDCKYQIDKLEPCTEYEIKVEPNLTNNFGKGKTISGTTSTIQPGPPTTIKAIPYKLENIPSLKIQWDESKIGLACVRRYRVNLQTEIHGVKYHTLGFTVKPFIIIVNLLPCSSYLVTVTAIGHPNDEDGMPSSTFKSEPTPPLPVVPRLINSVNVPAVVSTATTIALNWKVVDVKNNCSIDYLFTSCVLLYSNGYGFELHDYGITNYTIKGQNVDTVRLVVDNLSPVSRYNCYGWTGGVGVSVPVFTKELAPSPPQNFRVIDDLNTTFAWDPAKLMPGRLQKYRITFNHEPLYPVPDVCLFSNMFDELDVNATYQNYTWPNMVEYSNYTAYMQAQTRGGWSNSSNFITFLKSDTGVPDEVTNLTEVTKPLENDSNILETKLYWNLPCSLKGELKHFEITVYGENYRLNNESYSSEYSFTKQLETGPDVDRNEVFSITLEELKPDYSYLFQVSAVISDSNKKGKPASWFTEYPAGIPPQPTADYLKSISLKPNKVRKTTTSFEILLPLFPDDNGEIVYYAVMVSRLDYNGKPAHTRFDLKENIWPNVSSWRESMEHDFQIPYQASEPHWTPYPNYILDYGSIKAVKFVVGDDNTCRDVSLTTKRRLYCNGPLKPGTLYEVRMRAFTSGGYADAPAVVIRTDAETSIILIVGVVFGIMVVGIILTLLVAGKLKFKRKEENSKSGESSCQDRSRARRGTMTSQSRAYDAVMRTRRR